MTSRVSWARPLLLSALVVSTGCGAGDRELSSTLPTVYPLVAFDSERAERVLKEGAPDGRWVALPEGLTPAITGRSTFSLSWRIDDQSVREVRGRYVLLFGGTSEARASTVPVRFRILLREGAEETERLLLEDTLGNEEERPLPVPFAVALPAVASGPSYLSLETVYERLPEGRPTAAWLDPVAKGARSRTVPRTARSWNVVFVTSDTTRRDALGCYGGFARTPHLEGLADRGIVFDNSYSVAFGTTPSHASLLTASPPVLHGVYDNQTVLDPESVTLAEVLASEGWATAAFVGARPLARSLGLDRGFDLYDDLFLPGSRPSLGLYARHERPGELTVSRFLRWLAGAPEPFFAWLHLFDPHQPYWPPDPTAFSPRDRELAHYFQDPAGEPRYLHADRLWAEAPASLPAIGRVARERYRREIEQVDRQLGRVLAGLSIRGVRGRTIVVFAADHGENFLEHSPVLAFDHASLLPSVAHIPLVLAVPGAAARRSNLLVGNLDIAPTILDLLRLRSPGSWTGRSVLPHLSAVRRDSFRPYLVLEGAHEQEIAVLRRDFLYREILPRFRGNAGLASTLGFARGAFEEVFDLRADPLALDPLRPDCCPERAELQAIVFRYLAGKRRPRGRILNDDGHLQALRALGYLQ